MEIENIVKIIKAFDLDGDIKKNKVVYDEQQLHGFNIVVLDKGFVYVGNLRTDKNWGYITQGHNLRRWGTSKGLGELSLNGPQENTILDKVDTIKFPLRELKHMIKTMESRWIQA